MGKKRILSVDQNNAADPSKNVWVQANAGTGKTSVLVQRLLRILFRSPDAKSTGILCLTYTNAAAGEMRNRILSELRAWASASDDDLTDLLYSISEHKVPTPEDIAYARKMFFVYIDNPDMLKIKTIHGFCEEILRRFPLETGLSPSWSLVSDDVRNVLLQDAFSHLLTSTDTVVTDAFAHIVGRVSEYSMPKILNILSKQYEHFFGVKDFVKYRKYFIDTTQDFLNLNSVPTDNVISDFLENIIKQCENAQKSLKTPVKYLSNIITLTRQYIDKTIDFDKYKSAYLTQDGKQSKNLKKYDFLLAELDRVYLQNQFNANKTIFADTVALFDLSAAFAQSYMQQKQAHNLLDFEDLILYTRELFSDPATMGWILSQLDVSLSHILVDEAQDTSPIQWDVLRMLTTDFFTDGDTNKPRSLFVVGDTKQSIYGFMGANPDAFVATQKTISSQITNNLRMLNNIPLDQSFRSLSSILYTVDAFFNNDQVRRITGFVNNNHKVFRHEATGLVEVHKLVSKKESDTTVYKYIQTIAQHIQQMIESGKYTANDFMVLVQKRAPLAPLLVNELKRLDIAVAGSDRIILPDFPAITDLLNLVRFCIDTTDDYRLSCVLKSPLYRFSESDLYNLCSQKNIKQNLETSDSITLFDILQEYNQSVFDDLSNIVQLSKTLAPYSFFTHILNHNNTRQSMIAALGNQIIDPLEEFLTICLAYERTQPGTMRHFIKWFITGNAEIKRDMDASSGVRVMTVHGSKGLQSRVVFLIDTVRVPDTEHILPLPQSNTWIWTVSSDVKSEQRDIAVQALTDKQTSEYYRLLYVAMTRACDELYIYGFTPNKTAPEVSWHNQLWTVLSEITGANKNETIIRITHE
ncbi:MAG: UvrD-helicase domain-containing protein [Proteobacteria bacterium]|nr:UvrD-helicase domain-containing protein [Candidatus Enterousia scatequi]